MLYLLFRITVFLVGAASLGFGVGWYVRQVSSGKREADFQKQLNTARSRVPQLEASLKNREIDCERTRQELGDWENKFIQAGTLIEKRDHALVERNRKITQLNNSLELLKAAPNHHAGLSETGSLSSSSSSSNSFISPENISGKETELSEQKNLISQLEGRLDIQDQLIREAETRAETKATALTSLESNHARQLGMLEEMLAESQVQVAKYVSSQNEADENNRRLADEVSELRSAESQHESEVTNLEKITEKSRQEKLALEQDLEQGQQVNVALEQDIEKGRQGQAKLEQDLEQGRQAGAKLEQDLEQGKQAQAKLEQEIEQGAQALVTLEQNLEQSRQVQFFLEQDLGNTGEAESQLADFEETLATQQETSRHELAAIQAELSEQKDARSLLKKRNSGLEEQLTRSRQAQLKLASGYNEGMEARKQLEEARNNELRMVQRHRALEETIKALETVSLPDAGTAQEPEHGGEPVVLYAQLPVQVDDLKKIKGLGVAAEKQLNSLGIYHFQQIAEFDSSNIDWVEKQLKKLKGRFRRDDWIAQAAHILQSAPPLISSDSAFHQV